LEPLSLKAVCALERIEEQIEALTAGLQKVRAQVSIAYFFVALPLFAPSAFAPV
jgi:hypothetical protein